MKLANFTSGGEGEESDIAIEPGVIEGRWKKLALCRHLRGREYLATFITSFSSTAMYPLDPPTVAVEYTGLD